MLRASALAMNAGLMLAIGSSLEVYPVAGLPAETLEAGGQLALVTMGATPYDELAAVKLSATSWRSSRLSSPCCDRRLKQLRRRW